MADTWRISLLVHERWCSELEGMSLQLLSLCKPTISAHSVVCMAIAVLYDRRFTFSNARAALLSPAQPAQPLRLKAVKAVPSRMHGSMPQITTLYTVYQYLASAFVQLEKALLLFSG